MIIAIITMIVVVNLRRLYYEARNDHSLMDALINELSGNLEYLCCRLMAGAKGIAEKKGSNLTTTPEEAGALRRLVIAFAFLSYHSCMYECFNILFLLHRSGYAI